MATSSSSILRWIAPARTALAVVTSQRTSWLRSSSRSPASRTYLRTAESVHPILNVCGRRWRNTSLETSSTTARS